MDRHHNISEILRPQVLQQKKAVEKPESEEERAARLEALAVAAKEAAVRREEAARQKQLDRQKHEQVSCRCLSLPHPWTSSTPTLRQCMYAWLVTGSYLQQDHPAL